MKKPVAVVIAEDILPAYRKLVETADEEKKGGINNSEHQQLLKSIENKILYLKMNPQAGIAIAKAQIPRKYVELYKVTNLWKMDLIGGWRLIYTLKNEEVEILAVILDIYDHPTYDKVFDYRKSR
jgi:mRNA-degrading endonuclease RelE of RelBE toxin-antitoxin system